LDAVLQGKGRVENLHFIYNTKNFFPRQKKCLKKKKLLRFVKGSELGTNRGKKKVSRSMRWNSGITERGRGEKERKKKLQLQQLESIY